MGKQKPLLHICIMQMIPIVSITFVLLLLVVLTVFLRKTASGYPFGISKLYLASHYIYISVFFKRRVTLQWVGS
jgi:hypothetical protein